MYVTIHLYEYIVAPNFYLFIYSFIFTVCGFTLQEITLSKKKRNNFAKGVSSRNKITINLRILSFHFQNQIQRNFVFRLYLPYVFIYLFICLFTDPLLHHLPGS